MSSEERRKIFQMIRNTSPVDRLVELRATIGHTPLLEIHFTFKGTHRTVYSKAEYLNFTGSIKDRMALHVLWQAYATGQINPGDTIAEATSGNTGIAFAALGRALGHPVIIYIPDWMSSERTALIQSYGARVERVSRIRGGFIGSIECCEEFARREAGVYLPRQFSNAANVAAHEQTTGPEIASQLAIAGLQADAFVAGVGTGGTVVGVGRYLRSRFPAVCVHPLEPAESPTLSVGTKQGHHRIQGISDEFIPPICNLSELDSIVSIHDGDAILMAQKLSGQLGLGVGVSSGANFLGALSVLDKLGTDATVVTVFCDDNRKYFSTDLFKVEPVRPDYLSTHVELRSFSVIPRTSAPELESHWPVHQDGYRV
jgi:cysteine synthase A